MKLVDNKQLLKNMDKFIAKCEKDSKGTYESYIPYNFELGDIVKAYRALTMAASELDSGSMVRNGCLMVSNLLKDKIDFIVQDVKRGK